MNSNQNSDIIARQLEGLSNEDRDWVLSQINEPELKSELESELERLGLENVNSVSNHSDGEMLANQSRSGYANSMDAYPRGQESVGTTLTMNPDSSNNEILFNYSNLNKISVSQVLTVLQQEPAWVVLVILNAFDCAWKKPVAKKTGCKKLLKKYDSIQQMINSDVQKILVEKFVKKLQANITNESGENISLFESTLNKVSSRMKYSDQQWDY